MKLIKLKLIMFLFLLMYCSHSYADFLFQDNTLMNQLRVCNESKCEILNDGNSSTITNITHIYEIGGDKLNINLWDLINANIFFVLALFIGLVVIVFIFKKIFW